MLDIFGNNTLENVLGIKTVKLTIVSTGSLRIVGIKMYYFSNVVVKLLQFSNGNLGGKILGYSRTGEWKILSNKFR